MADPENIKASTLLIVDPDSARAMTVGELVTQAGATWAHVERIQDSDTHTDDFEVVLIAGAVIVEELRAGRSHIRGQFAENAVLVGLVDSSAIDSPSLFGAGLDLVVHEPIGFADIQRMLMFVESIRHETARQSRERLRRMVALHQLAISAGRQTSTPGWMDRLIGAGQHVIGSDALAMWSLNTERRRLDCIGSAGLPSAYIQHAEENSGPLVDRYPSLPLETTSYWLSSDEEQEGFGLVSPGPARDAGIERVAWMPVRDSQRVYGHLSFYFTSLESFEEYDLILADAFASIVAASLGSYALQAEIHRSNRLYREHVEMSPHGVVVCQTDGIIERANLAMSTIAGRGRYEILGNPVSGLFANPDELPWERWLNLDYDDRDDAVMLWMVLPDGRRKRVACYARRVELPQGLAYDDSEDRIQLVMEDVTAQAHRLVELELLHELTRLFSESGSLEHAFDLVVERLFDYFGYHFVGVGDVVDQGRVLVPRAFRSSGTIDHVPLLDASTGLCGLATRENRSILVNDVSESPDYYSIDPRVQSELVSVIRAGGSPVGLLDIQTVSGHPLDEGDLRLADSISAHLGLLIDQVTANERLERQAMTDPLIGIANRRALMEALNELVTDPDSPPTGFFLVELDNFKDINDRYGHLVGDETLKQVGHRLLTALEDGDLLARYGGDELAVIVRDLAADQAMEIAERLRQAISEEPIEHDGQSVLITVSIGVALFPTHGRTTDELIGEADRAMYTAKLAGRNRVYGDFLIGPTQITPES